METTTICKNCEGNVHGNYCSNCGQAAHTHSINWHYVWHEIEHGVFHVDKGLFFTIKELFAKPGKTIRAFIAGKRSCYFKPAAMVFLLASIYGFLYHYFHVDITMGSLGAQGSSEAIKTQQAVNAWMTSHFALVTLLMIPLYALGSYWSFRKEGYNFVEHLVLNSFLAGQKLTLQLALFPVVVYYNGTPALNIVLLIMYIMDICLTGWTYSKFFTQYRLISKIFRTILTYIIILTFSIIVGTIAGMVLSMLKLI